MSHTLISRSDDLRRLQDEGYHLEVRTDPTFVLIKDVPYVTADRTVKEDGVIVSTLNLAGDATTTPDVHTVEFIGDPPCDKTGQPLKMVSDGSHRKLAEGLEVDMQFSRKPAGGYANYYDKLTTYVLILTGPAEALKPSVTAKTFPIIAEVDEDSVFRYYDSASSRAGIGAVSEKLKLGAIAIVGLGGTGSYVLDLVAKTPVKEIHLFDGDKFLQHNAFRAPGAASLESLTGQPTKVQYFADLYGHIHRGVIAHPEYLTEENVESLRPMDFVFLCLDDGDAKRLAVELLETTNLPFVEVGMGLQENKGGSLGGILRVATSTPDQRAVARRHMSLSSGAGNDEYARNIQTADLNALNSALAVIKWKKLFGFYTDLEHEHHALYTIDGNHLLNEGGPTNAD